MLYNLLGRITWKALKLYLRGRVPSWALPVAAVVAVLVTAGLVAKRTAGDDEA